MSKVLISSNGYEQSTRYGLYWARIMAEELERQSHDITFIENGEASEIDAELETMAYDYFYHLGHGCEYITTTYLGEDLYWVNGSCGGHSHDDINIGVLANVDTYLLSCLCGASLIPYIGRLGSNIAGYVTEFNWTVRPPYIPGSESDIYSSWFFKPANRFFIEVVNGRSFSQAYDRTIEEYDAAIEHWITIDDRLAELTTTFLIMDKRGLIAFENNNRISLIEESQVGKPSLLPLIIPASLLLLGTALHLKKRVK